MEASFLNETIAKAMGDNKITRYVVRDGAGELVMAFMDGNLENPHDAQMWIQRLADQGANVTGLHVDSQEAWPDYLNMTRHAARFINWAFKNHPQCILRAFEVDVRGENFLNASVQSLMISALLTNGDVEVDAGIEPA